ncbi:MAG: ATP-binding protein [Alphaproteobacteria bacterium]|nr:ATP-binding protein [Alphaproteobacteria bacterium]
MLTFRDRMLDGAPLAPQSSRWMGRLLVGGFGLLLAVLWGLFAYSGQQQLRLAREAAISNTATLAKLVDAWALSTLDRLTYLAASLEIALESGQNGVELYRLLASQHAADPDLFVLIEVLDAEGQRMAASDPAFPIDAARNFDSDLTPTTPSHIGLPRAVGDRVLIPMSRPLLSSAGAKVGYVVVEIDPRYFAGFSANLGLPEGASVVMMRADSPLLASTPARLGILGRSYRDGPLWEAFAARMQGWFEAVEGDGVARIVSYRSSPGAPFVVSIGFAADRVYAETWQRIRNNGAIGGLLTLVLALSVSIVFMMLGRNARAERAAYVARSAMDSVRSGVAVLEADGACRIVLANPAFGAMLSVPNSELAERTLDELLPAETLGVADVRDWLATRSDEMLREVRLIRPDGGDAWFELRVAPIPDRLDRVRHAVLVVTDTTARKRTEQALVRAKDSAEAASRTKSDFLANMSHELRTPLNAVIGFADTIAGEMFGPVGSPRYREYAELIRLSGTHLLQIISDILDLAKIEADKATLDETDVSLPDVLAMCATLVAGRAQERGVKVRVDTAPGLSPLHADELRVKQIVLNLLSNAVKFSPEGAQVLLSAAAGPDGAIEIAVRDHGCGMTEEGLKLALEPFRQVNSMIAKQTEGTGLGLPLAARLAQLHGGKLLIESVPGQGTLARVFFPPARSVKLQNAVAA